MALTQLDSVDWLVVESDGRALPPLAMEGKGMCFIESLARQLRGTTIFEGREPNGARLVIDMPSA